MSSSCDSNPSSAPPCKFSFSVTASILQFDGVTYSSHCLLRLTSGFPGSFDEDLANVAWTSERSLAPLADRLEHGINRIRQLCLHLDVANLPIAIASLEIVDFGTVRIERIMVDE